MIDRCVLLILSVIDIKTKEIPIISFVGAVFLMGYPVFREGKIDQYGGVVGATFLFISLFTKQALGFADSAVLFLLGLRFGGAFVLEVFLVANLCLLPVVGSIFIKRKKTGNSIAFLPFLTAAFFLLYK